MPPPGLQHRGRRRRLGDAHHPGGLRRAGSPGRRLVFTFGYIAASTGNGASTFPSCCRYPEVGRRGDARRSSFAGCRMSASVFSRGVCMKSALSAMLLLPLAGAERPRVSLQPGRREHAESAGGALGALRGARALASPAQWVLPDGGIGAVVCPGSSVPLACEAATAPA